MDDIFRGLGAEIELQNPEDFLKVKETLTRIGIASRKTNTLYQSCHILHKRGRYSIFHFKELFVLDGKADDFSDEDLGRRNTIVNLLVEWNLISTVYPDEVFEPTAPLSQIKIIAFRDKKDWELSPKYSIGKR
ncbi:MAG: translation repressor protein [Robiginitomaculum sp.]|nr:MAG: translation repressor protein [Robiginitomaculum sp.]